MVKINDINSTATFAWSNETLPTLATGTAAGVIDDDFSSNSVLSFYDLEDKEPKVTINTDAKFHDLDWSKNNTLLAGALENGTVQFWNTSKLNSEKSVESVATGTKHTGAIKSLQFNPLQHNILASGGANSEIFIWDTNKLTNLAPFAPGTAMTPMDTVQSVSWNNSVSHIFASAGSAGYTSIWDLKAKKEVLHLTYTNNTGSRANLSVVAWHPTQSTKLITASESDGLPVLLTWDLRNSNAPESILTGHKKGILSIDWNTKDPEFLLSSGKDNTTILWNPISGQKLAQYPTTANWVFKTRFAPSSPDIFASASFDKKISIQTLQDTSPPAQNRINSTTENDFWNQISDTDTQQPEYFIKQAPKWYGAHSAVGFGFGGKIVTVTKTGDKQSEVKISKVKVPGSKDNENLKTALNTGDFKSLIESHLKDSHDDVSKSDWELLNELTDKSDVFEKFISLKISTDDEKDAEGEKSTNGEDFFNNLGDSNQAKEYLPSGPFKLVEQDSKFTDLSNALLAKDLNKAVDISLSNDKLVEALIISQNGSEELKQKVKNAYFAKYASKDPLARLLYSVSSDNVNDLVENGDVADWKQIGTAIKTYSKNEELSKTQLAKLGDRILASDPVKNRNDAIKTYITASALDKVAAIWVGELKGLETKILKSSKKSAYDAHFESLTEFVEKFSAYRSILKLDAPVTDNEALLSTILEFTNIISTSGQFELANKFLGLLSDQIPAVKLEKERIAKASGIRTTNPATSTTRATGAGRYGSVGGASGAARAAAVPSANPYTAGAQPQIPGFPPAPVAAQSPYAQFSQPPVPGPPAASNPYRPSAAATPSIPQAAPLASSNPYKPAASIPSNPYKPVDVATPVGPPGSVGSVPPPPPKIASKKNETEGWNDLPSTFHRQPRRGTPAAAVNVATPYGAASPSQGAASLAPPISRTSSFVNPPSIPPPPRSISKSRVPSVQENKPSPPPAVNNRYAPTQPSPQPNATPLGTNGSFPPPPPINGSPYGAPPAAAQTPKNPYAPTTAPSISPVSNPYAPPQPANVAPPGAKPTPYAPPPQSTPAINPYAPPPASSIPPPPAQGAYAPPLAAGQASATPLTAAASLQQHAQYQAAQPPQQQQQPPQASSAPPKSKYPAGDRAHIPAATQNIYQSLSKELEQVKPSIPEKFNKQVLDTEKRLNILFDHLNNEELLTQPTIDLLNSLIDSLNSKDYQTALNIHIDLMTNHSHEGGNWLVGIKRLIQFSEAVN